MLALPDASPVVTLTAALSNVSSHDWLCVSDRGEHHAHYVEPLNGTCCGSLLGHLAMNMPLPAGKSPGDDDVR